jgi:hypothetical protein
VRLRSRLDFDPVKEMVQRTGIIETMIVYPAYIAYTQTGIEKGPQNKEKFCTTYTTCVFP